MGKPGRAVIIAKLQNLATGLAKYPIKHTTILAGRDYSTAQLAARLQESIDAEVLVQTKKAELREALAACKKTRKREATFLDQLKSVTITRYGNASAVLQDHGLELKKPNPKRTTEQRLLMKAKNQATRKMRGTLGPKKKKAITGNVTGVIVT